MEASGRERSGGKGWWWDGGGRERETGGGGWRERESAFSQRGLRGLGVPSVGRSGMETMTSCVGKGEERKGGEGREGVEGGG